MAEPIEEIAVSLAKARHDYQAAVAMKPIAEAAALADKVRDLTQRLSSAIVRGANACPDCENLPVGIQQPAVIRGQHVSTFEVGCVVCHDHRAFGLTLDDAVANWNASKYLPRKAS